MCSRMSYPGQVTTPSDMYIWALFGSLRVGIPLLTARMCTPIRYAYTKD